MGKAGGVWRPVLWSGQTSLPETKKKQTQKLWTMQIGLFGSVRVHCGGHVLSGLEGGSKVLKEMQLGEY